MRGRLLARCAQPRDAVSSSFVSRCTLELGGELVAAAEGATLEAEYALFDAGEIELSATAPGTIRETGYRTTVGEARTRLAHLGATRELAEEATAIAKAWIAKAYARGAAVRRIVRRYDRSRSSRWPLFGVLALGLVAGAVLGGYAVTQRWRLSEYADRIRKLRADMSMHEDDEGATIVTVPRSNLRRKATSEV